MIYRFALKEVLILTTALLLFAFLLEPAGLLASLSLLVFISSFAWQERTIKEALALTLVIDLLMIAIFVGGIGLEINLWPQGW